MSSPFRRGAPRPHWPELVLSEASHGVHHFRNSPPLRGEFSHPFYQRFAIVELKNFSSTSIYIYIYTTRFMHLL